MPLKTYHWIHRLRPSTIWPAQLSNQESETWQSPWTLQASI